MVLRITSWNVNGIRNPFSYQPWRDKKTFAAMFDILEADIVVFQETKIQRKDLRDDMVLVPGWDCYFSLPKHKKGYSGVVIYTRQSTCCPIRAEEGITGVLCPPNSSVMFSDLPADQQIGGYPTPTQASAAIGFSELARDFAALDSEGRCVILEFPAFVLFGVYSPANRDETRDDFRLGFLSLLDARVRNLVAIGKRVVLTGDLNISKGEIDTANADSAMRRSGMNATEYWSTPARRMFNHLLDDGKVYGKPDRGREKPVMSDVCRNFHPTRTGMFTCWEQKVNARPGNYGARIDYVLCSLDMKGWFSGSDIQEGLMGSDHCPVYATMKEQVELDGKNVHILDLMNPPGVFHNGKRLREYSTKDILSLSGRLIPEFDGRQSIRDMFKRIPVLSIEQSAEASATASNMSDDLSKLPVASNHDLLLTTIITPNSTSVPPQSSSSSLFKEQMPVLGIRRQVPDPSITSPLKRVKSSSTTLPASTQGKGQQSLKGFFKHKSSRENSRKSLSDPKTTEATHTQHSRQLASSGLTDFEAMQEAAADTESLALGSSRTGGNGDGFADPATQHVSVSPKLFRDGHDGEPSGMVDLASSKESWSRLFAKPAAPLCEGHDEPCVSMLTKKSGMNCGRWFWICRRPLGPSGAKEKGTQWRCPTFIWCSDWTPSVVATSA